MVITLFRGIAKSYKIFGTACLAVIGIMFTVYTLQACKSFAPRNQNSHATSVNASDSQNNIVKLALMRLDPSIQNIWNDSSKAIDKYLAANVDPVLIDSREKYLALVEKTLLWEDEHLLSARKSKEEKERRAQLIRDVLMPRIRAALTTPAVYRKIEKEGRGLMAEAGVPAKDIEIAFASNSNDSSVDTSGFSLTTDPVTNGMSNIGIMLMILGFFMLAVPSTEGAGVALMALGSLAFLIFQIGAPR